MNSAGPVVFVLFVLFMLYFLWSIKDVSGAEREWEFYAVLCAKAGYSWEKTVCIEKTYPLPRAPTPWQCQSNGMKMIAKWTRGTPGTSVKKFGCRVREQSA